MKLFFLLLIGHACAALLLASQAYSAHSDHSDHPASPCDWSENYGFVKAVTPYPAARAVHFTLAGGKTAASMNGVFSLPVPTGSPVKLELFREAMDLVKDAQARGTMLAVETTSKSCYVGNISPPEVEFVTTQARSDDTGKP